jgi:hypothetical protein
MKVTLSPDHRVLAVRGLCLALLGACLPSCVYPPPPPPGPPPVAVVGDPGPIAVLPRGAVVVRPGVWRCRGVYYRRHPRRAGYVVFRP